MSPIPVFDGQGLLPPFEGATATTPNRSPYDASMVEVATRFGTNPVRKALIRNLLDYRELIGRLGYTGVQFVDGSFVEDVEAREGRSPNDIDVFSFLIRPSKYQLDWNLWQTTGWPEWTSEIVNNALNKTRFKLDTYGIAVDQGGLGLVLDACYWSSLFAHKRVTHEWKGFLRITIDAAADANARPLV